PISVPWLRPRIVFSRRPAAHAGLPSFPTRRSSDLVGGLEGPLQVVGVGRQGRGRRGEGGGGEGQYQRGGSGESGQPSPAVGPGRDRKSTRLNSSHVKISYAVFCLKKKTMQENECGR